MKIAVFIVGLGVLVLAAAFSLPRLIAPSQPENSEGTLNAASLVPVDPPATYAWVDKEQGIALIPIARAMDIVGEKGLPWGEVEPEPEPVVVEAPVEGGAKPAAPSRGPALDPAMVEKGLAAFTTYRCGSCHVAGSTFPPLNGKYGTRVNLEGGETALFDDAYILESMVTPNAKITAGFRPIMPGYKDRVTEDEMKQIIQYIRSLK